MRPTRVYVAGSVSSYGSAFRSQVIETLRARITPVGGAVILPEEQWSNNAEWLSAWPEIVGTLTELVLVPDEDGSIGSGCLREVADALAIRVPVTVPDTVGRRRPWRDVTLVGVADPTPGCVGRVIGEPPAMSPEPLPHRIQRLSEKALRFVTEECRSAGLGPPCSLNPDDLSKKQFWFLVRLVDRAEVGDYRPPEPEPEPDPISYYRPWETKVRAPRPSFYRDRWLRDLHESAPELFDGSGRKCIVRGPKE